MYLKNIAASAALVAFVATPTHAFEFNMGAVTQYGGSLGGVFTGQEGYVDLDKFGGSFAVLEATVAGDGCVVDCADGTAAAELGAEEHLAGFAGSTGSEADEVVSNELGGVGGAGYILTIEDLQASANADAAFAGLAAGIFSGDDGDIITMQEGGAGATVYGAADGLCPDGCGDLHQAASAYAYDATSVDGWAAGHTPGEMVSIQNSGLSQAGVSIELLTADQIEGGEY